MLLRPEFPAHGEKSEDYYDENGVLNKDLFRDNEDLFI